MGAWFVALCTSAPGWETYSLGMRFAAIGVVTLALSGLVAACSSGSPGSIDSPGSSEGSESAKGEDSGQTGSLAPDDESGRCDVTTDCEGYAAEELLRFTSPTTNRKRFDGADCALVVRSGRSGAGCVCHIIGSDSSGLQVGPAGLDCYALGRAGECLLAGNEFEGCDVSDATSCDAVCADLEQRYDEDAARAYDASILYASCEEQQCKTVLQIGERCVADSSYLFGRSYDCAMGGEAIWAAEQEARTFPESDELPEDRSLQVVGTNGHVSLTVERSYSGTGALPPDFYAGAQFVDVSETITQKGEVIDPLEGVDDCGVSKPGGGAVMGKNSYHDVADVQLLDGDVSYPLVENGPGTGGLHSYFLYLTPESVEPRYGERYGVHVSGGSFGAAFDSADGLQLPQELSITELMATSHVEQQDLALTWTGQGAQPLYLHVVVGNLEGSFFDRTELNCLMKDDGAFTIPAAVLQAMPTGIAYATFERSERHIVKSGARSLVLAGTVAARHLFALGSVCDGSAALDACLANAEQIRAAYTDCDEIPPSLAELCPDFLATSCDVCPEYFECLAEVTSCTAEGFSTELGCSCPG
jgi:hypothetical protein